MKIRIAIADDNPSMRQALRESLADCEDMEIVAEAENGVETLEKVEQTAPDILLLDIVMPTMDGFGVLDVLSKCSDPPTVIVVSAIANESFILRAIQLGASFFLAKPFDVSSLRNRIYDASAIRSGKAPVSRAEKMPYIRPADKSMDEKISTMFITMGIPAHIKGYVFLREAVKMVIDNPDIINRITKELYPGIARSFDTSASKVERAIRHAIEVAWTRGKIENINDIFGYNVYNRNDKPTNGEFIALIADKISLEKVA